MAEKMCTARWVFDCLSWKPIHSELIMALSAIQPEEKERIAKFVFMKDAKSSLVGRLLMRKFICDSSDIPWNDVKILRDSHEKPFFKSSACPPIHFNVSHQGRYVVFAGEVNRGPIGIDVMEMDYKGGKSISEFFRLMNRNFAPVEWQTIKEPKEELDQLKMFYRYWCLKESYVKATGTGITIDLRTIVFKVNSKVLRRGDYVSDTVLYVNGIEQQKWEFHESLIDESHCVCVALFHEKGGSVFKSPPFCFLNIDELLDDCKQIIPFDSQFCQDFLNKS